MHRYWTYIVIALVVPLSVSTSDAAAISNHAVSAGVVRANRGGSLPEAATVRSSCGLGHTRDIQAKLASYGYTIVVDDDYGPQTTRVVKAWQRSNGLAVDGCAGPLTVATLHLDQPATATVPAVRVLPPVAVPPAGAPSDPCAEMASYRQQAGLPEAFDAIGFRESHCDNGAANACCYGWWQNYLSSHLSTQSAYRDRIINECGVNSVDDMLGDSDSQKRASACVTYVVWSISGLSPWSL